MSVPLEALPPACRDLLQLLRAALAGRRPLPLTNWAEAHQQATWHGVDSFLYPTLASLPADQQPPPALRARWRQQSFTAAAATVRREAQARELLVALAGAQVSPVPLKGTWLAARIYPEPSQRTMSDIDLLVPPAKLAAAQEALAKLGYTPYGITASLSIDCEQVYTCPRHAWPLELHWQLGMADLPPLHRPDITGLWPRLVPETLLEAPVLALCPEEHLVFLAYHVLHHRFQMPLRAYLDLVLLGRFLGEDVNRAKLNAIAAEWGMEHALPRLTAIAHDLLDQPLPTPLADWMIAAEEAQRVQAIHVILATATQPALSAERRLLDFQKSRPIARLALVWQRIFVSHDYLRREYPCARWRIGLPLAYLLRTRDLLRRNAKFVRQALQHDPALTQQLNQADARAQLLHWALKNPAP